MDKTTLPLLDDYLLNIKVNNYSKETLYNYERDLMVFEDFLNDSNIEFDKITKKNFLYYKAFLSSNDRKTANKHLGEKQLGAYSINRMLSSIRSYFKFLIDSDHPVPIPPDAIKMTKTIKKKSQVAELDELTMLLESPAKFETNNVIATRNRAILEVLFATGMRISELINLEISKIDKEGKIFILGKGKKERFAYLTPRSMKHLDNYLKIRNSASPYVFVPYRGLNSSEVKKKLSPNYIQSKIKTYRELLGIVVPTSAHSLRHGFATYLAESGANPAAIQILLGHESLDTTTRYVHASDKYAQKNHKDFHPLNK